MTRGASFHSCKISSNLASVARRTTCVLETPSIPIKTWMAQSWGGTSPRPHTKQSLTRAWSRNDWHGGTDKLSRSKRCPG
ncbi:hypothetical protein TNCV_4857771 [Trichonephila clavipes]|nr:hypothetical protein TNCV_4857771 [Trichonephila clavipes]